MSRARAVALALVNWKGVFYERYLLDRHVTALEGANGAGKTTVMIAAYVVLLPDMTKLRFTNLGETSASGGDRGIWGRLGFPTRPAYSALDLDVGDGQRVVAGVMLTRKAEPTVELTPFLVRALAPQHRLQDVLLLQRDDEELVPELAELKENVAAMGLALEVFGSAKDYFAALFDLGVSALRLTGEEERSKLSDMLRTSMTGGISRAITSELRGFLLREQSGLGDTLARMRQNLDACRRTRIEVAEAQRLEQEINGVYGAGHGMFVASVAAFEARVASLVTRAREAELAVERARAAVIELEAAEGALAHDEASLQADIGARREALERMRELARRAALARELVGKRDALRRELAEAQVASTGAAAVVASVQARRDELKQARVRSRAEEELAARGLANLQAGLDELHRRAGAHRQARRALEEARRLLETAELQPEAARARSDELREALRALDERRLRLRGDVELAELREAERNRATRALEELAALLVEADPQSAAREEPDERPYERARVVLGRWRGLEERIDRAGPTEAEAVEAERLAVRQRAARALAQELSFELEPRPVLPRLELQLRALDGEIEELGAAIQALEREVVEARHSLEFEQRELEAARKRLQRLRGVEPLLSRIREVAGGFEPSSAGLARARANLSEERHDLSLRAAARSEERERLLREASDTEASGGRFPLELLRLRDELDAELLASRFEDLEPADAARLEARLGPLARALVVEDVEQAIDKLRGRSRELAELRLVGAGVELALLRDDAAREQEGDVIVSEGVVRRVAKIPAQPSLGRRAREARVEELRSRAVELAAELEREHSRLAQIERALEHIDRVLGDADALEAERGDPIPDRERRLEALVARAGARQSELVTARARAAQLRHASERYRQLAVEAYLLDDVEHAERAERFRRELRHQASLRTALERGKSAWKELERSIDALRSPVTSAQGENVDPEALDRERDRLAAALQALEELVSVAHALAFDDAERALGEQHEVAPALEEQHRAACEASERIDAALGEAELEWEGATRELQRVEGRREACAAHLTRLEQELAELGDEPASAALVDELSLELRHLEERQRAILARRGELTERTRQAREQERARRGELDSVSRGLGPARAALAELRSRALHSGLDVETEALAPRDEASLLAETGGRRELLIDRLRSARGGEALAEELLGRAPDALADWLSVRDWLARRVPVQLSGGSDPLEALARVSQQLHGLEHRLKLQEQDLRGASEDVARGIEVQLRRAKSQVRRLNQTLGGVTFGSIGGIRVELRRVPQLEPVLRALAEGAAQELLFQTNLPIEDALSEILRRFGGGRMGQHRLLDYREYIELAVEVQRRAEGAWEPVSPTRLSTGEAIGVGAALMMVVLAEWERDANLLRNRRGPGSLRFLFLDEANRLSQDNLGVLFDLCRTLDLQLLIAAPEVARAEGNTTYRLVRKVTEDGREEVIVSGRRALRAEELEEPPAPPPVEAVSGDAQLSLEI